MKFRTCFILVEWQVAVRRALLVSQFTSQVTRALLIQLIIKHNSALNYCTHSQSSTAWSWGCFPIFREGRNANPGRCPASGNRESLSGHMSSAGAALTAAAGHHTWGEADFSQMVPSRACANLAFLAAALSFWFINWASLCVLIFWLRVLRVCTAPQNQHTENRDIPATKGQRAWPQHFAQGWKSLHYSALSDRELGEAFYLLLCTETI